MARIDVAEGRFVSAEALSHEVSGRKRPHRLNAVGVGSRPVESPGQLRLDRIEKVRSRAHRRPWRLALPHPGERSVPAVTAWVAYMAVAVIVVLTAHSIIGDAWSRVANAYYVLYSRDPHLAAMGFVWNPLPSLAVLPLLPLKTIWPDMVATGFAGSIVSALCMTIAVWQVHGIALDWRVRRSARLLVVFAFALNPMIVYYGANGMSEAMFIAALVVSVRYLARWARSSEVAPLVVSGLGLAAAYLTRYEAAAVAISAFVVVVGLSAIRRSGAPRERIAEGMADGAVLIVPFVTVFIGWALASWLIVGDPFQQFTSIYGVVSQLAVAQSSVAASTGQGTSGAWLWIVRQLIGLEPGVVVLGAIGLVLTFRGRWSMTVPTVAILGAVVAFAVFGFMTGRTLGWLRYSITIIPLVSILALAVLARDPRTALETPAEAPAHSAAYRLIAGRILGLAAVALVVVAVPVGVSTMLDPAQNPAYGGEAFQLRPVLFPGEPLGNYSPFGQYDVGHKVAAYLDPLHLANGTVLVDSAMGFPIILESANPGQFSTTPDRDFQEALLDPVSFRVKYFLVPEAIGYQSLDAINRAYPGIYDNGAGVGQLVGQFSAGGNNWRLYQVSQ